MGGAALALLASVALGASAPSPASVGGTYRLRGTARIAGTVLLDRDFELHADAVLEPGDAPGEVRVHLASQRYACDLAAALDDGGALAFEPGQRCTVELHGPDLRGHLEARLRAGHGQIRQRQLALELAGDLSGMVVRAGEIRVFGAEVPERWSPAVPVRGRAEARAEGFLDESKAGAR